MKRLKNKWGITSTTQVVAILAVFSLAGMSVTRIRPLVWAVFGFGPESSLWMQVPAYIMMMFPTYQVMLLVFGTLLGQFEFFWAKEKAMVRFLLGSPARRGG